MQNTLSVCNQSTIHDLIHSQLKQITNRNMRLRKLATRSGKHGGSIVYRCMQPQPLLPAPPAPHTTPSPARDWFCNKYGYLCSVPIVLLRAGPEITGQVKVKVKVIT